MGFTSLAAFNMASFCFQDDNLAIIGRGGTFVVEPSAFVLCEGRGLPTRCDHIDPVLTFGREDSERSSRQA